MWWSKVREKLILGTRPPKVCAYPAARIETQLIHSLWPFPSLEDEVDWDEPMEFQIGEAR